jgi:hypothetical protein
VASAPAPRGRFAAEGARDSGGIGIVTDVTRRGDSAGERGLLLTRGQAARSTGLTPIRTERTAAFLPSEVAEALAGAHPLGRVGATADVAAVLFLASGQAAWLLTPDVAGGRVMLCPTGPGDGIAPRVRPGRPAHALAGGRVMPRHTGGARGTPVLP